MGIGRIVLVHHDFCRLACGDLHRREDQRHQMKTIWLVRDYVFEFLFIDQPWALFVVAPIGLYGLARLLLWVFS